jgi:lipopolysaccharide/colanic/teichoic acid biosynthesis glycosyltransferase
MGYKTLKRRQSFQDVTRQRRHPTARFWNLSRGSGAGLVEYDEPLDELPEGDFPGTDLTVADLLWTELEAKLGSEVEAFFRFHFSGRIKEKSILVRSINRQQIEKHPEGGVSAFGVLQKINNSRWINKFFRGVNSRLEFGGVLIGCAENNNQRKRRLRVQSSRGTGWLVYLIDCLVHRIWPKVPRLNRSYFALTRGHSRPISEAELLGRLVSCGFSIIEHREIGSLTYFAAAKRKEAAFVSAPTYGPFCVLPRVGRGEGLFKVYKFRTMHPYAEFLQEYIYQLNDLAEGGKFKNDFRVPTWGRWMRRLWLDELPMIFNVVKGEMKWVGVRPLSVHYFGLYPPELQEWRRRHTPGLLPPFYADLPKNIDEIVASEMRYLAAYEKNPIRTDLRYFCLAVRNIVIRRARSA